MPKSLDQNITTVGNLQHATKPLNKSLQMYVQLTGLGDDDSALIEITELQLVLPKKEGDDSYLVLRCK
jgi:hypothetical protein